MSCVPHFCRWAQICTHLGAPPPWFCSPLCFLVYICLSSLLCLCPWPSFALPSQSSQICALVWDSHALQVASATSHAFSASSLCHPCPLCCYWLAPPALVQQSRAGSCASCAQRHLRSPVALSLLSPVLLHSLVLTWLTSAPWLINTAALCHVFGPHTRCRSPLSRPPLHTPSPRAPHTPALLLGWRLPC